MIEDLEAIVSVEQAGAAVLITLKAQRDDVQTELWLSPGEARRLAQLLAQAGLE